VNFSIGKTEMVCKRLHNKEASKKVLVCPLLTEFPYREFESGTFACFFLKQFAIMDSIG